MSFSSTRRAASSSAVGVRWAVSCATMSLVSASENSPERCPCSRKSWTAWVDMVRATFAEHHGLNSPQKREPCQAVPTATLRPGSESLADFTDNTDGEKQGMDTATYGRESFCSGGGARPTLPSCSRAVFALIGKKPDLITASCPCLEK